MARHFLEDHLTPEEVGKLAKEAGVKRVVLTHLVPNVPDEKLLETFVEGVQKFFPGDVVVAKDLMSF